MSPFPVTYLGEEWRTAEHLFQALRFHANKTSVRRAIRDAKSPMSAKMVAKAMASEVDITPRGVEDVANMRMVLELKCKQHPALRVALQQTGSRLIVEDVTARPHGSSLFWGAMKVVSPSGSWHWGGTNALGKLWMAVREEKRRDIENRLATDTVDV